MIMAYLIDTTRDHYLYERRAFDSQTVARLLSTGLVICLPAKLDSLLRHLSQGHQFERIFTHDEGLSDVMKSCHWDRDEYWKHWALNDDVERSEQQQKYMMALRSSILFNQKIYEMAKRDNLDDNDVTRFEIVMAYAEDWIRKWISTRRMRLSTGIIELTLWKCFISTNFSFFLEDAIPLHRGSKCLTKLLCSCEQKLMTLDTDYISLEYEKTPKLHFKPIIDAIGGTSYVIPETIISNWSRERIPRPNGWPTGWSTRWSTRLRPRQITSNNDRESWDKVFEADEYEKVVIPSNDPNLRKVCYISPDYPTRDAFLDFCHSHYRYAVPQRYYLKDNMWQNYRVHVSLVRRSKRLRNQGS